MSIAERTRQAVREEPFLQDALRAGVLNYTAAARFLDVGEEEAVSAALRRYEAELNPREDAVEDVRVTMQSDLGHGEPADAVLTVGDTPLVPGAGSLTAVIATGSITARALRRVLGRCETAGIQVKAAGVAGDTLLVVVGRRDAPMTVRIVEGILAPD